MATNGIEQVTEAALAGTAATYGLPVEATLDAYRAAYPGASAGDLLAALQTDWWQRIPRHAPGRRAREERLCRHLYVRTNRGKVRFMAYPGAMSPDLLIEFMRRLVKDAGRKVLLILDNLNVHKAKKIRAWLDDRTGQIEVLFLPPYSPEPNPDEYLNGDLKRAVHQDVPPRDAHELRSTATRHLRAIQRSGKRVKRYFAHPSIRCAA